MADPFIGEIIMFGGNFAPRGWARCDGQLLSIATNTALFSILGTTYGGDGQTTFGLPDLRGRVPVHAGTGPGLTSRPLGSRGGEERVVDNNIPAHSHTFNFPCNTEDGETDEPNSNFPAKASGGEAIYSGSSNDSMGTGTTANNASSGQPHQNMQPFQAVNFIIALTGLFPTE